VALGVAGDFAIDVDGLDVQVCHQVLEGDGHGVGGGAAPACGDAFAGDGE